jgi:hypothetical protein
MKYILLHTLFFTLFSSSAVAGPIEEATELQKAKLRSEAWENLLLINYMYGKYREPQWNPIETNNNFYVLDAVQAVLPIEHSTCTMTATMYSYHSRRNCIPFSEFFVPFCLGPDSAPTSDEMSNLNFDGAVVEITADCRGSWGGVSRLMQPGVSSIETPFFAPLGTPDPDAVKEAEEYLILNGQARNPLR